MDFIGSILLTVVLIGVAWSTITYVFFRAPAEEDMTESVVRGLMRALVWPVHAYNARRDDREAAVRVNDLG